MVAATGTAGFNMPLFAGMVVVVTAGRCTESALCSIGATESLGLVVVVETGATGANLSTLFAAGVAAGCTAGGNAICGCPIKAVGCVKVGKTVLAEVVTNFVSLDIVAGFFVGSVTLGFFTNTVFSVDTGSSWVALGVENNPINL